MKEKARHPLELGESAGRISATPLVDPTPGTTRNSLEHGRVEHRGTRGTFTPAGPAQKAHQRASYGLGVARQRALRIQRKPGRGGNHQRGSLAMRRHTGCIERSGPISEHAILLFRRRGCFMASPSRDTHRSYPNSRISRRGRDFHFWHWAALREHPHSRRDWRTGGPASDI